MMPEFIVSGLIAVAMLVAGTLEYKAMKRRRRKSPEVVRSMLGKK